jgi:LemA protein
MWSQLATLVLALSLSGCGYNTLQQRDEAVKAAWSSVLSAYQKRADLVPNLVGVVSGYATHEKAVFSEVAAARARTGQVQATPDTEAALQAFSATQTQLGQSLSRVLAVAEAYPDLKADAQFHALQKELVKLEDQIAAARKRYIREVRDYNVVVRSFPTNLTAMAFGHTAKANFQV